MPPTSWSIPNSLPAGSSIGRLLSGTRMSLAGPTAAWEAECMPRLVGRSSPCSPKGRRSRRKPYGIDGDRLVSAGESLGSALRDATASALALGPMAPARNQVERSFSVAGPVVRMLLAAIADGPTHGRGYVSGGA